MNARIHYAIIPHSFAGYVLVIAPTDSSDPADVVRKEVDGDTLSTVVHGLDPGIEFDFTVVAENGAGLSPVSRPETYMVPGKFTPHLQKLATGKCCRSIYVS